MSKSLLFPVISLVIVLMKLNRKAFVTDNWGSFLKKNDVIVGQVSFLVIYLEMIQKDDALHKHLKTHKGRGRIAEAKTESLFCSHTAAHSTASRYTQRGEMGEAEDVVATGLCLSCTTMALPFLLNHLLRVNQRRRRYKKELRLAL